MMVDISKFWIEGVLLQHFPNFISDGGADLDGNGAIEGTEAFADFDGDTIDRSNEDYITYLKLNRSVLSAKIPFFRWGEKLNANNRIHQLMYLESDLATDKQIESVYLFISELADNVEKQISGKKMPPKLESQLYYYTMEKGGAVLMDGMPLPGSEQSFIAGIINRRLDCDTSSILAMALGDEQGLELNPVWIYRHIFLKGTNDDGKKFNIDFGEITSDDKYRYIAESLEPLNDHQLQALFLYNLGNALGRLGRNEEAIAAFDMAIHLHSGNATLHHNRGVALSDLGRYEDAKNAFTQAIQINPNLSEAHHKLAIVLLKLGQYNDAIESFKRALKLDPNNVLILNNIAFVLAVLGKYEESLFVLNAVLQLDADNQLALERKKDLSEFLGHAE